MQNSNAFKWKSTGRRLSEARHRKGLTQQKVAEHVGVRPQMVWYWEAGRSRPNPDRLVALASLFGCSISWLLGQEERWIREERIAEHRGAYDTAARLAGEVGRLAEDRPVPLEEISLASVAVIGAISAGGLVEAWQQDLGSLEVPSHILRESPRAFGLRVQGNSLASEWIYEGAIVVVDPDAQFIDGKIYAVMLDGGEVAARRIFQMGEQLKLVTGDGRVDEYPKRSVTIIGRVRWSFREH